MGLLNYIDLLDEMRRLNASLGGEQSGHVSILSIQPPATAVSPHY